MKRLLLPCALFALALSAASCAAPAPSNNANQTANTNAATPTPSPASVDFAERDRQVYDAIKRKDWDAFAAFIGDDYMLVVSDGVHDRATLLEGVKTIDIAEISFSDFKTVNADPDVRVVTYTTRAKGTMDGAPLPEGPMYESSVWVNREGKWLAAYHQETAAEASPSPSPGGASPAPTATATAPGATATPASTPATATDATGMEKLIWDALKRKDWDAFAGYLAEDQIEVWQTGVHDKAASVAGVKQVNFAGSSLSDFREMKLTPNATLVTYVAKGAAPLFGPDGERHTTLWVNRGGRWLAVFHQATRIKK
ncbi:MAG TPA: nuclear transport factor 2 family protein [Pyrinomonadaceae bacterium]|nr:nuclear transport factor 2 family protein [Pyrinomonadaceae bacterium]